MAVAQIWSSPPQFVDENGDPYSGALLFFYAAGSSTKQDVFTDSGGGTAAPNPTTLNATGYPEVSGNIFVPFGTIGLVYKIGLAAPGSSDPPSSFVWEVDDIAVTNDTSVAIDQWISGPTPTYIAPTQFSLVGDQTSAFHVGRRVKTTNSGGTVYSRISASAFAAVTTVTLVNDGAGVLDAGLSAVSYGLLTAVNPSVPLLVDTYPLASGSSDKTKTWRVELDGLTTGTERVFTPPDQNLTIGPITAAGDTWEASGAGVVVRNGIGTVGQIRQTSAALLNIWADPVSVQTFSTAGSGTPWTKPTNVSPTAMVLIRAWGAGGSGGKGANNSPEGGGGGGAFNERLLPISALASSETVTVGAGGVAQTVASTAGNPGGDTTFGTLLTAYGGGGGGVNAGGGGGGGGGGVLGAGTSSTTGAGGQGGSPSVPAATAEFSALGQGTPGDGTNYRDGGPNQFGGGGGAAALASVGGKGGTSAWGGGGGGGGTDGAGTATVNAGGSSLWGGGGGGGAANSVAGGSAGTSVYGGNGSAGTIDANASAAGTQPGGGSGGTEGGDSGKGGDGRVIVYVFNGT